MQPLVEASQGLVVHGTGGQGRPSRPDEVTGAAHGLTGILVAAEIGQRLARGEAQGVGVGETLVLGAQGGVLAGLRVDRLDLLERRREGVDLSRPLARLGHEAGVLAIGGAPGLVERADGVTQTGELGPTEVVEHLTVSVALAQTPLVGLAVDGDEHLAELGEHTDRGRASTDVGAGAAGGGDAPGDDELTLVVVGPRLGRPGQGGVAERQLHDALDEGGGGAGAHEAGVGALSEQQAEPRHDHRLAGTGLAREHVEPRAQLEQGVVDDTDAPDPHLAEHDTTLGSGTRTTGRLVPHPSHRRGGRRRGR